MLAALRLLDFATKAIGAPDSSYGIVRANGATSAAIEAIYRSRSHAFLRSATALLRDPEAALDAVQEGFALALRRREGFRGEGGLEAWVWQIVLNVARDLRRSRRWQAPAEEAEGSSAADPTDDLRESLLALPERQRLAVFLRYYATSPMER